MWIQIGQSIEKSVGRIVVILCLFFFFLFLNIRILCFIFFFDVKILYLQRYNQNLVHIMIDYTNNLLVLIRHTISGMYGIIIIKYWIKELCFGHSESQITFALQRLSLLTV